MNQGVTNRDGAVKFFAVIVRRVFLAVEFKGSGHIVYRADRSYDGLNAENSVVERGRVHEWLEHRAGLAARERVIELALTVIAAADEGTNFAGLRIHGHQSHLHLRHRFAFLFPEGIALGEALIHALDRDLNRVGGSPLQLRIESRVDPVALRFQIRFREFFQEMIFHHVHEVGRGASVHAAIDEFEFQFLGGVGLLLRDVAIFHHLSEHAVARFFGAIEVAFRGRIAIGRADNSSDERFFSEIELADVLAEIRFGRFAESPNGETAAVAEIHLVGVQLENLLFRIALVDLDGHQDFLQLPRPFALGGEKKAARHLHVNGAGALSLLAAAQIRESRAKDTDNIQSAVFEESLVFRGEHGIHHVLGKIVEANHAAFFAGTIEEVGDQLGLDIRSDARGVVGKLQDPGDRAAGETHAEGVPTLEIRVARRPNIDCRTLDLEFSRRALDFAFLIACAQKIGGQVAGAHGFTGINVPRAGKHSRSVLVNLAGEALIDQFAELNVVIGENRGGEHQQYKGRAEHGQTNARCPETSLDSNTQPVSPLDPIEQY